MHRHRVLALAAAAACATAIAVASPAAAASYELSGTQVGVTPDWALNYGGLLGAWNVQGTLDPASVPPIFRFTGTETFHGCLNLNHDDSCYKEPSGTLSFSFEAWIKSFPPYDDDSEVRAVLSPDHRQHGRLPGRRRGVDDGRHADTARHPHPLASRLDPA